MLERNQLVPHNTEDKNWWCLFGTVLEDKFVDICQKHLKLDVAINPEKKTNKYAPDLLFNQNLADLKTQNTPFFTANRYGLDPRLAVTFNRKDYERYKASYPHLTIFFWVDWQQLAWKDKKVEHLAGIYQIPFKVLQDKIESGKVPEHHYIHRVNDHEGNAKSSFIFQVTDFIRIFETSQNKGINR